MERHAHSVSGRIGNFRRNEVGLGKVRLCTLGIGELVESEIYYGIITSHTIDGDIEIHVDPREISKVCGNRRRNIERLKKEYGVNAFVKGDSNLKKREVRLIAVKTT